jgi:hypothetical protein
VEDPILVWLVLTELCKKLIFTSFVSYNVKIGFAKVIGFLELGFLITVWF